MASSGGQASVGLAGSYGGLNAGDEAILTVAAAQLRATIDDVEIVVFSRDTEHTRRHHEVDRVVSVREAVRDDLVPEVERLDLLLLGGGGILYDHEASGYLHVVRIAQELGVCTATFAIGAGPLEHEADREAVADVVSAMDLVTVRDAAAKRLLEEIGVEREITVTADPALLLESEPFPTEMLEREGVGNQRRLVGVSVRERGAAVEMAQSDYHELLAGAADFIVHRFDAEVVFVALERQDIREAHRVIGRMGVPEHATVLNGAYSPTQLRGLMEHLHLAVGMRLHFLIFAATSGVPIAALPYSGKVEAFLDLLGLAGSNVPEPAHPGVILATIDRLWDTRDEQVGAVRERLPELQEAARETARMTAALLGRDAAAATS
ncbi:MAG: polysaccharide pyruvyl transferase family protein [Actinomycetota bacterium]|nr:polysaccharide pyruvyl transferase family protein [Actinomycetota bacterium]